jgi:ABC-type sugar transport system ATPase subunit
MTVDGSELSFEIGQARALAVAKRRNDAFIVSVRPQKFALVSHERGTPAEVIRCDFQGERTVVEARNGMALLTLVAPPDTVLQPGSTIRFMVEPDDVLVFDRSTGHLVE